MPVLALQARALGADVSTAALVVALWPLGMLATSLPAGALVARLGERTTLLLAGLVDAVAHGGRRPGHDGVAAGPLRRGQRVPPGRRS